MLTIFAALNDEIKLIKAEMEMDKAVRIKPFTIFTGKYQNRRITLVRAGVGKEAAETAMAYLIEHQRPVLILNIGYAGGLDPHLHPGDLIIAKSVVDGATEEVWNVDGELVGKAASAAKAAGVDSQVGRLVTVDKPLTDPHEKAFAGTRFEAAACDMESSVVAGMAEKAGVPCLVVRSIFDSLDTELPVIPGAAIFGGKLRLGPLVDHLKSHPKDILKLPKFSYLATQARIALTNFVKEWMANEL